jgi:hypothetical protein
VFERSVNLLVYSLSLHRHSYIGFILDFASSIHNKQTNSSRLLTSRVSRLLTSSEEVLMGRRIWVGCGFFSWGDGGGGKEIPGHVL